VQPPFEGSLRQLRGRILSVIIERKRASFLQIQTQLGADPRTRLVLKRLEGEGFLRFGRSGYSFK
jgi:hypothetical protein